MTKKTTNQKQRFAAFKYLQLHRAQLNSIPALSRSSAFIWLDKFSPSNGPAHLRP